MNNKNLFFSDNNAYPTSGFGTLSIGVLPSTTPMYAKLTVLEEAQLDVDAPTSAIYGVNRDKEQMSGFGIIGVKGRSDKADNLLNIGGSFKASRGQRSIGIIAEADSAGFANLGANLAGSFVAGNPFTADVATSTVITALARNSINTNTGGNFVAFGVDGTNSIDIGIYAQANTLGSTAIQSGTDWAADLHGNVYVDGTITSAGNPGWSDINLKENIDTIANALDSIKLLKPTQYKFKAQNPGNIHFDDKRHFGFIAQEVETVYPNLVSTTYTGPELDSIGNISHASVPFKALDYTSIIALAVKAIQELDQKVTTQDSLITALNNQLQSCCNCNNERTAPNQILPQVQVTFQMDVHLNNSTVVYLGQNAPNPFIEHTVINFVVPSDAKQVEMQFFDIEGKQIQNINIAQRGSGLLNVYGENLSAGTYTYVLVIDGKVISSKRMMKSN